MKKEHGGMPANLFLVRHGQSEGNLVRKQSEESGSFSFFTDEFLGIHESQYKLTDLGIEQAKKAGKWLKDNGFTKFDRMLVSNNVRARHTAGYLNLPYAEWMEDSNLRERDGGLFNTINPEEIHTKYGDQQKFHDTQPFLFRPPQGESIADVCQRIKIVLDTLARECEGKNVIIVCHGHVMRTFRIILERMSLEKANEYLSTSEEWGRVPNCSIMHFTRRDPKPSKDTKKFGQHDLSRRFDWYRMIRPAKGGKPVDNFSKIKRKKYSNKELLS